MTEESVREGTVQGAVAAHKRLRGSTSVSRVWRVVVRAALATAILWMVLAVPLPLFTPQLFVMVHIPAAIFLFIAYLGKTLFDTFFYDRYPP